MAIIALRKAWHQIKDAELFLCGAVKFCENLKIRFGSVLSLSTIISIFFLSSQSIYATSEINGVTYTPDDNAHILIVDLSNPAIKFRTVLANDKGGISRESVESMAKRYNAFAAINADYFGKGHGPEGMTYVEGKKINYDDKRSSLAISDQNKVAIGKGDRPGLLYNVVGGGPRFIQEGRAYWNRTEGDYVNGEHFPNSTYWDNGTVHTAAGITKDGKKLILVVTKTVMKPLDIASKLIQLGAWTGMKFDGGGSSALYFDKKVLKKGGREVADALVMIPKDLEIKQARTSSDDLPKLAKELVKNQYGTTYHVAIDDDIRWDKYIFENFIVPERNKNPNFPYLVAGDFNGDGIKPDLAVFIVNSDDRSKCSVVMFHAPEYKAPYDLGFCSDGIDLLPPQTIKRPWENYSLSMKSDGMAIFKFESFSVLFFWDGKGYSRYQLSD